MKGQEWYQADDVAEEYDDKRFSQGGQLIDRREKEAVLEAIMPVEDRNILEIACGTGRFTVMLAEQGADVVGLDISAAMLQQGRKKTKNVELEGTLEFLRGDAGRLPFPDDHFDTVIAMRFFHLADDPEAFLTEMRRVSSDQIVFDTFNRFSARSIYNWALPMGSRLYSKSEVSVLLAKTELTLVDVEDDFLAPYGLYRSIPNGLASPIRTVDETIGKLPVTDHLASVSYWDTRVR
ncbi:class I SAM-dependent methyltransferase [Natronorubrum daqingense]|uniref:Methyltransferase domain-containing protein n=1 Tax=Natronorubrum daqingense TaxID=588898 RepID=A0A1N6YS48_9EURY|nr:class I SAM-dependent methyltransferase [Natronorubrum daqingense]APX95580.1 SAM-dependent methyltransferase [Natronorubrum daqingense]SIR17397.1 Methyltransferase domain-containing protein [Natronorubrum daqingense]